MGVEYSYYIGPYIRATIGAKKVSIDKCEGHNFPEGAVFCPTCGTKSDKRITVQVQEDAPDDWEDKYVKGDFRNYLMSTSSMCAPPIEDGKRTYIFLPNRYHDEIGFPSLEADQYSEVEVPFDDFDFEAMKEKFFGYFKDEIEYLSQWFQVEVKTGYISYAY